MGSPVDGVPEAEGRWVERPFASTFDLILSEYGGYTDEGLLDVTLGRLHQMRDVIVERRNEEQLRMLELEETKLRVTTSATHAAAGNKKGMKAAAKLKLFERPKKVVMASYEQIVSMFGGDDA